jgi:Pectate lyase superfamily protein/Divergent InlB B-repeat domain
MKAKTLISAVILTLLVSLNSALALGGATVPWTTYEAENMTTSGTNLGPSYAGNNVASESSGRQCVQLNATGQFMQFSALSTATAIVVRYSVPDSTDGKGTDYTISLYKNGSFVAKLPMTSRYSWLYGSYPFTNNPSSGSPRNFYDEVRTNGLSILPGDTVRLEKDITDTATSYVIDLVDLENAPAAINQPGGSVSIKSSPYNAVGDGVNDDTTALQLCINGNTSVYLPPGTYKITGSINLPSTRTIQGAGMWYTTLVGDTNLYATSSRRITLNGNGNNIHLSDLAVIGKLNYRNDNEPNDGLGGSFGTGSTISNVWVEHTKTGAWLVNSSNLVVNNCRFRDTIADGCNLVVGMRSCIVTNCTARGTGDDCFPIWPATYMSQTFTPGLNIITHCTGQVPFLANGGAIYGGVSNRIEDCLFQDIPYDCGILISTTFPVGANTFSGTTVAQRCDLIRCGGTGMGAGLQICLQGGGISGVNLNNLNITNSASDGLSIINGAGSLSSAIMSYVNIPNYGLGGGVHNGLWARSDAVGSMTVSNCTVVEYKDDSPNFTFNFVTSNIPVTVQTSPSGQTFTVDGTNYSSAQTLNWLYGSSHTIATTSPQSGGSGVQYVWSSWNDSGALSHTVTATTNMTYTANFTTQYFLTMNAGPGGSVNPGSGWNNSNAVVNISATASNGYAFSAWVGSGSGSYSGTNNSTAVTMNGPITETASFDLLAQVTGIMIGGDGSVTVSYSTTSGLTYHVETTTNLTSSAWTTVPGSTSNAAGSIIIFIDPNAVGDPQRFYRIGSP